MRPKLPARLAGVLLAVGLGALAGGADGLPGTTSPEAIAAGVASRIEALREEAGASGLKRLPALDEAATDRARVIAALPDNRRLAARESVEALLKRHGVRRYRGAETRVAILAGYPDLAAEVVAQWHDLRDSRLLDPEWNALGIGAAAGRDDEVVVVALFVEDTRVLPDLLFLEEQTEGAVNEERERHGLAALRPSAALRAVARAHSEDMALRGYFDHASPDGTHAPDRVRSGGLRFSRVSENIARNLDADDPVRTAVDSWLESPGHRVNILDPEVVETGVGVAADEDGRVYFTQIFFSPAE